MKLSIYSKDKVTFCLVDDEDFYELSKHKWHLNKWGYAIRPVWVRGENRTTTLMLSRVIMSAKANEQVDHINRDKLDNRKINLRLVTRSTNGLNKSTQKNNKSGHRGVFWEERIKRWRAMTKHNGRTLALGSFKEFPEAVEAYHKYILQEHTLYCCK